VVRVARGLNAALHIIARTRYVVEIPELTRLGANAVIPEEFETSIEIFARVLGHYGVPRAEIERLVTDVRSEHYAALLSPDGQPVGDRVVTGVPQLGVERLTLEPGAHAIGPSARGHATAHAHGRPGALSHAAGRGPAHAGPTPAVRGRGFCC